MSADRWNEALEAAAKAVSIIRSAGENTDQWTITRDLAFREAESAILALREADPGGQGHESSRSRSEDSSARESVADLPARSGPCVAVPVKPTEKMLAAANRAYGEYESTHMTRSNAWNQWRHIYAAMLAAAEQEGQ